MPKAKTVKKAKTAAPAKIEEAPQSKPVAVEERIEDELLIEAPTPELPADPEPSMKDFEDKQPLTGKAMTMKAKLAAEPKVRFFIPLGSGEKMGVSQSVNLNGYPMYIRKGEAVSIPESIANILEDKMKQQMRLADHPNRLGGDGSVKLDSFGS